MTVGDLRKAIEGVADDMRVVIYDEAWWRSPEEAKKGWLIEPIDGKLGYGEEGDEMHHRAKPFFLIA